MTNIKSPPITSASASAAAGLPDAVTEDAFLGGRLRLRQPRTGHRAGHDALLLAAFVPAKTGDRVVDFGAGVGAAGLAVATRVDGIDLALCERDAALVGLAQENIALNGFAPRARAISLDVVGSFDTFVTHGLMADSVDQVLMNPPFNATARHRASPDSARRAAHAADDGLFAEWVHAARRILRPRGVLSLIARPESLADVLAALATGFGAVHILPVHSGPDRLAIRMLVGAVKGSRGATALMPALVLADAEGVPTPASQAILRGGAALGGS